MQALGVMTADAHTTEHRHGNTTNSTDAETDCLGTAMRHGSG